MAHRLLIAAIVDLEAELGLLFFKLVTFVDKRCKNINIAETLSMLMLYR